MKRFQRFQLVSSAALACLALTLVMAPASAQGPERAAPARYSPPLGDTNAISGFLASLSPAVQPTRAGDTLIFLTLPPLPPPLEYEYEHVTPITAQTPTGVGEAGTRSVLLVRVTVRRILLLELDGVSAFPPLASFQSIPSG